MSFLDVFWWIITVFFFFAYLMILWSIFVDLFSDSELSGVWKAIWIVALIFVPLFAALAYVIFRGRGMQERKLAQVRQMQAAQDEYIRSVASSGGAASASPAEQISHAKQLLDSGAITQAEFDALKAKAIA
jgi:hypothetical protein